MLEELEVLAKSPLFGPLGVDPTAVGEIPCGMVFCTGPALTDRDHWMDLGASASKDGQEVGAAESTVPLCPPHVLVWEVIFSEIPGDLLTHFVLAFVEPGHLPIIHSISEEA